MAYYDACDYAMATLKENKIMCKKHLQCTKIYTRENGIIIYEAYQCHICGKIMTVAEYQKVLTDNCSLCNEEGYHEEQGEKYNCECVLDKSK